MKQALLEVDQLSLHFPVFGGVFRRKVGQVYAVDSISFKLDQGQTLGVVGESGCGKSTLARAILQLYKPTQGTVRFDGQQLTQLDNKALQSVRQDIQIIFQDPSESLNSRHSILELLSEPFIIHKIGNPDSHQQIVSELLEKVGLPVSYAQRFPHELSGGQRQRVGIARAIALNPKLVICDEAVSALDVSVQSQVMNLLLKLQREMGLAYIFIAHDLAAVKHVSDNIAVMYLGQFVETASAEELYKAPLHPYTRALISAIPIADPDYKKQRIILHGDVPSPLNPPAGCRFHTRCPHAESVCRTTPPPLKQPSNNHSVACHFAGEI